MPDIQIPLRERQASRRKRFAVWTAGAVLAVVTIIAAMALVQIA